MAFTTGTATDYHDLLGDLRTWLTGTAGWTQLRWTAPASITDRAELWVRGPGAGASRQTFVGIESRVNTAIGAYGWALRGATAYDGAQVFGAMPGISPETFFNTSNGSMTYWFYANDRRVIVIARVGTVYACLYCGFLLPFALPAEHPFPLAIIGHNSALDVPSLNNSGNRFFIDPGAANGYVRDRGAVWRTLENHGRVVGSNENVGTGGLGEAIAHVWPHRVAACPSSSTVTTTSWTPAGLSLIRPTAAGETPLIQCHVICGNLAMLGAMDGVYAMSGFGRTSEQVVTSGARDFMLFQNLFRSTPRDFMAIEEL